MKALFSAWRPAVVVVVIGILARWFLAPATPAATPSPSTAADPLQTALQDALLNEEGRRDLTAAIAGYEQVIKAVDAQRRLAATAVFRLAECYRKLGRTNEASPPPAMAIPATRTITCRKEITSPPRLDANPVVPAAERPSATDPSAASGL